MCNWVFSFLETTEGEIKSSCAIFAQNIDFCKWGGVCYNSNVLLIDEPQTLAMGTLHGL